MWSMGGILILSLLLGTAAYAGNTSQRTHRGAEPVESSVYCQNIGGVERGPEYGGTRRQIPCGPNFGTQNFEQPTSCSVVPPDVRERLMQAAAELDRIATAAENNTLAASDKFFRSMAQAISANLKFLAEKPSVPAQQMASAIWTYLNNDYNENDRRLYEAAAEAVQNFEQDPPTFLGAQTGNILFGEAMARMPGVMRLPTCRMPAGGARAAQAQAQQLQNAAEHLVQMDNAAEQFAASQEGAACRLEPQQSFGGNGAPGPNNGLPQGGIDQSPNPFQQNRNCVPVAIADEKRRLTGRPWTDSDVRIAGADEVTGAGETGALYGISGAA